MHNGTLCKDNRLYRGNTREGILPGGRIRESRDRMTGMLKLDLKANKVERGFLPTGIRANGDRRRETEFVCHV